MTEPSDRTATRPDTATEATRAYLPAMGRDWLLPLYDPFTRAMGAPTVHRRLIDQADLRSGQRVLEIGCGTANLLLLIKRQHPDVAVVGLDPDPKALDRARRKARRAALSVDLDRGFAAALPYPGGAFDRVFSAFMLHHLRPEDRLVALREVGRVLAPGGSLHLVDVGGAPDRTHRWHRGRAPRRHQSHDNLSIPTLIGEAGLDDARETGHGDVVIGRYTLYRANR